MDDRRLQTRVGKVIAVFPLCEGRQGESESGLVTLLGEGIDDLASRISKTIVFGYLVEGFPHRVVYCGSQNPYPVEVFGDADDGMASRNQESDKWVLDPLFELGSVQVGQHVVYTLERLVQGEGHRLGERQANGQGAYEAWLERRRYTVEPGRLNGRYGQRLPDYSAYPLRVGAGSYLGHHSLILGMEGYLCRDNIRKDFLAVLDDGGGAFVAGRLNSQDEHRRPLRRSGSCTWISSRANILLRRAEGRYP